MATLEELLELDSLSQASGPTTPIAPGVVFI